MTQPPTNAPPSDTGKSGNTGIFRLSRSDLVAFRQAADELGQAFFRVNLETARNIPGFIRAMSRDLGFPGWFGGNLDALHDCLTDLSWRPAPGYIIVLEGYEALRSNPTSFAMFNEVLASVAEAWQQRKVPFRVFYLQDDTSTTARRESPSGTP